MSRIFKRLIAVLAVVSLAGQGCTNAPSAAVIQASKPFSLNVWAVVDDEDVYDSAIRSFHAAHPNITINYRRFRLEEYEDAIVNALAEDRGPDVLLIHNNWVGKYATKIAPMPTQTTLAYATVTGGGYNQQTTWDVHPEATLTVGQMRNQFADVVAKDAIRTIDVGTPDARNFQPRILGIPVAIDTLALYYNKDLLNTAGIPTAPENWREFQEQVKKLTKVDSNGNILQSAVGMGTGFNVERSPDLMSILMMQNGAQMVDDNGFPTFTQIPADLQSSVDQPPAYQAMDFYTSFADPNRETYTWNSRQPSSLDAFIQGKAAFFFGYDYQYPMIKAQAPKLNLGITKLPQIENNPIKNFANYWLWTVSKKSAHTEAAWNFVNYITRQDNMKTITTAMAAPAARKALLSAQMEDERVGVFASQVLTSDSWYRGTDPKTADQAFQQMAEDILHASSTIPVAVRFAADQVGQTIQ